MIEIRMLGCYLQAMKRSLLQDRHRNERGVTAEYVILVSIFALGAIVIGGIIVSKFTDKANSIPTGP